MTIFYNILSAIFGLMTFALIQPFLNVLFMKVDSITDPGAFQFTKEYISKLTDYYLSGFVRDHIEVRLLLLKLRLLLM